LGWLAVAFTPLGWVAKQLGAKPLYTWYLIFKEKTMKIEIVNNIEMLEQAFLIKKSFC
ncbi:MAG: hypothetical protein H9Q67_02740, partial [Spiroplasma ixodetis]|nr:hypothetical protein [Spiroplasma ixodetis]